MHLIYNRKHEENIKKLKYILHLISLTFLGLTTLAAQVLIPSCLADLVSKARISGTALTSPMRWFLLVSTIIIVLAPSGERIAYILLDGNWSPWDWVAISVKVYIDLISVLGFIIFEIYTSSFKRLAAKLHSPKAKEADLADGYENIIDVFISLKDGLGFYLLVIFSLTVCQLVCLLYLITLGANAKDSDYSSTRH